MVSTPNITTPVEVQRLKPLIMLSAFDTMKLLEELLMLTLAVLPEESISITILFFIKDSLNVGLTRLKRYFQYRWTFFALCTPS